MIAPEGTSVTLQVRTGGEINLLHQWQVLRAGSHTWEDLPHGGYTSNYTPAIVFTATPALDGNRYRCRVTNTRGQAISLPLLLTVASTPVTSEHPATAMIDRGSPARFTVRASANLAVEYRWQANLGGSWTDLPASEHWTAANSSTLALSAQGAALLAGAQFRCVVSNHGAIAASAAAILIIRQGVAQIGDFNGDHFPDLLWRNTTIGEIAVWYMHGTSFAGSASVGAIASDWQSAGVGDLNRDGSPDLLWRNLATGEVAAWFMNGTTFAGSTSLGTVSLEWQSIGTGDFNHDARTDLLWRNVTTGEVAVWFMDGVLFAGSSSVGTVATEWQTARTGDFNGDGHTDLLWLSTVTGQVAVWYLDRVAFAGSATVGQVSLDWRSAGAGDFDGDGDPDLLWCNVTSGRLAVWYMSGVIFAGSGVIGDVSLDWQN